MKYPLRYVIFEVAQDCNLSCLYCYNHWRREDSGVLSFSYSQTGKTLSRMLRNIDFEHITFTGGEPFLADGLSELVLKARLKGKSVSIITNGAAATYEDYRPLARMGVSLFELPLHSKKPEVHDAMTACKGSYEKVIYSINALKSLVAEICTVIVLTKMNIDELGETLEFHESLGIKRIMLARFNIGGRGIRNIEKLMPSRVQLKAAFEIAENFCKSRKVSVSANVCIPSCIINQKDYPHVPISGCSSDIKQRPITIDAMGNLRFCNHSPHIAGNIHTESIRKILDSEYIRSWESKVPGYCSGCRLWSECRGGCRAASEQLGLGLKEDPIIQYSIDG